MKKLAALLLVCLPIGTSADVITYNKCKLNDGKTLTDVQTWLANWRGLVKKEGLDYRIRLLLPHADQTVALSDFFIEGTTSTFDSYGKAFQWWYTAPAAQTSNAELLAAATCDAGSTYRTAD